MAYVKRIICPACRREFTPGAWSQHGKTLTRARHRWRCSPLPAPHNVPRTP